jgi:hypothetical protein
MSVPTATGPSFAFANLWHDRPLALDNRQFEISVVVRTEFCIWFARHLEYGLQRKELSNAAPPDQPQLVRAAPWISPAWQNRGAQ